MRSLTRLLVAAVLVTGLAGCSDPAVLDDEATCPGDTCTDDAQERLGAIAALGSVSEVEEVSRSYGLDRGAFRSAVVQAEVADADEARDVALAVLRELDTWPDQGPGAAEATVVAAPPRAVTRTVREVDATPAHYAPCAGDCRGELAEIRERLSAELEGVSDLVVEVRGGRLEVTGRAEPEQATLAARGTLRILGEEAVALADRVEVRFSYRMPLEVTWRLDDGLVCEQPPGAAMTSCEDDNSIPFEE